MSLHSSFCLPNVHETRSHAGQRRASERKKRNKRAREEELRREAAARGLHPVDVLLERHRETRRILRDAAQSARIMAEESERRYAARRGWYYN